MTSPCMIICNFLVLRIKAIPLIFAYISIMKDFQFCDLLHVINHLIPLLCGRYHLKTRIDQFSKCYVPFFCIESKLGPWNVPSYLVIVENIWILRLTLFLMLFVPNDTIVVHGFGVACELFLALHYFKCCTCFWLHFPLLLPLPNPDLAKIYDKCFWSISANYNRNIPNEFLAMAIWS
jgi:hypothetical protein